MLKNYVKIALRNVQRYKGFSLINVIGLALSMAVCLLIILFIRDQKSYDNFHTDGDRMYRIYADYKAPSNRDNRLYAYSPVPLAEILRTETPGIESVIQIRQGFTANVNHRGNSLRLYGFYAEPSFFDFFSFDLTRGNARTALTTPNSVVISTETATRFFGEADPLGQVLTLDEQGDFTITGVLAPQTHPTHLPLDAITSMATLTPASQTHANQADWTWGIAHNYTYVLLEEGATPEMLEARLPGIIKQHFKPLEHSVLHTLRVQAISDINLATFKGNELGLVLPNFVAYFLLGLASVLMLVACFNYMNLTVARALKRAREVGVRKVVGARRSQIVFQFLVETLLVTFLSLALALVLLEWLLPAFNSLWLISFSKTAISVDFAGDAGLYLVLFGFTGFIALAAGLYPAFYLSRFQPATVVKGQSALRRRSGLTIRRGLTVTQLALSLIFMISTMLLYRQSAFMLKADYGFEAEHVINVNLQGVPYDVFRTAAVASPSVAAVSATSYLPGSGTREGIWLGREGMDKPIKGYEYAIDEHLIDNLGLTLLAGRNFSMDFSTDEDRAVILNETALRDLDLGAPREAIGRTITVDDQTEAEVIGVVADFQSNVIVLDVSPVALTYTPDHFFYANVRIHPGDSERALADLEAIWKTFNRPQSLDWGLYTVQLRNSPEMLIFGDFLRIIGLIAGLAIFIACLGLLAMATYSAQIRTKEVGIRKVMGAGVWNVTLLLSREFMALLLVAVVLAVPLAWLLNNAWLEQFANRIDFGAGTLAAGVAAVAVLALVTTCSQTIRAALVNPVESLRYE